jgi:hypothetical protein
MTSRNRFQTRRLEALLAVGALVAGMGLFATTASATPLSINSSVGGVPAGTHYENFDSLTLGSGGGTTASGIIVSFNPDGQAVTGAANSLYAAPFLSNNNGTLFGDPTNGADTTTYLTAGGTSGSSAKLVFPTPEKYLGLLWGSVDTFNTLDFYDASNVLIGSITGSQVTPAATGDQGVNGTFYVNINSTTAFSYVIATSSSHAFEFDNVAFDVSPVGVPEPGVWGTFLLGLLLVGSSYWLRGRRLA